jgi:hypothetical protein
MQEVIENIITIIKDYHNHRGFQFTHEWVMKWINQFEEEDREFILQEFLYLLQKGIYISEVKARKLLIERIEKLSLLYKFSKPVTFLANTEFLFLQPADKSQAVLLKLLDEELQKKYGIGLAQCGAVSKKYVVYIDDILATGGTLFRDCVGWLRDKISDNETNLDKVLAGEKIFTVYVFCRHSWANVPWRLKVDLKNEAILKKIHLYYDFEIQNHPTFPNQKLNFAYPVEDQPPGVLNYFKSVGGISYENTAFRKANSPEIESFFSSPTNRIRFENILLQKGIELLQQASTLKPNHRPLGATFPSYKTLGTGTLFFTWRNISNTTPVVFWWKAAGWQPLFPLVNRGLAM